MKLLLILLALLFGVWLWRSRQNELNRQRPGAAPGPATPQQPQTPQQMVRCANCGLHLPQADALPGKTGWYCCQAHRQRES